MISLCIGLKNKHLKHTQEESLKIMKFQSSLLLGTLAIASTTLIAGADYAYAARIPAGKINLTPADAGFFTVYGDQLQFTPATPNNADVSPFPASTGPFSTINPPGFGTFNDVIIPQVVLDQFMVGETVVKNDFQYDLTLGGLNPDGFLLLQDLDDDTFFGANANQDNLDLYLTAFTRTQDPSPSQSAAFEVEGFFRAEGFDDTPIIPADITFQPVDASGNRVDLDTLLPFGAPGGFGINNTYSATFAPEQEQVPEPSTILGLVGALGIGGLATKKSSKKKV